MHLIIVPYSRLATIYGAAMDSLLTALDGLLKARSAVGFVSLTYDPVIGSPLLGVAGVELVSIAVVEQLRAIEASLARRGDIIESLLIVGGPQVLPFATLANPLPDRDGPLASDAVYGMADHGGYLARWPVGRLPDSDPPEPGLLVRLLNHAARAHALARRATAVLGYTTACWREVSNEVLAVAHGPVAWLVSPPARAARLAHELVSQVGLVYCNLHGVYDGPLWYGQAQDDLELVPALRAEDLADADLSGAVAISQACYGARLASQGGARSLALAFLRAGVAAFVSTPSLAYGAAAPPASESDLLMRALVVELQQPGVQVGGAFLAAHHNMLRAILRSQGVLDGDDAKTLLAFVLYGDPLAPSPLRSEK